MKRFLISALAAAGILSIAAPAFASTAYPIGTVNVRSGPGTQNAIVATISEGQTASVLAHEGQWLKVATPGGVVGYMADWFTRELFDDHATYLKVTTDILNVRTEPDPAAPSVAQVQEGQQLLILEGFAGWYKVDVGALGTGWVKGEFTYRMESAPATVPPITQPPTQEVPRPAMAKDVQAIRSTTVFNGRSDEYDSLASVRAWEHMTYVDSAEGWIKVATAGGQRGWIDGATVLLTDKGVDFAHRAIYDVREGDWAMTYLKVREVVPGGTGLVLRSAPSASAGAVRTLAQGTQMKILSIPGGEYVKVMMPDGEVGWVSRNWLKPAGALPEESVRLQQTSQGVLRLEVTGQAGAIQAGGDALTIPLPANAARQAALAVEEFGVSAMNLGPGGLTLRFDNPYRYQVVASGGGSTVLEIRPVVEQAERLAGPDRETFRLKIAGLVDPAARRDGGDVVVSLPGARLGDGVALPAGLTAQADAAGLTLRVTSARSFALKRGAGTLDLVLLAPGLAGKTIVVDPGHGGIETGALGLSGLMEKTANLGIALKLKTLLESAGARVIMTRTTDSRCASDADLAKLPTADEKLHLDLNCRSVVANTTGADAFVSVHNNASPDRAMRGTETYWAAENLNASRSQALANLVQSELVGTLGLRNLGAKQEIFYVTKYTDAPAVLAEVAFVSNATEDSLLRQETFRQNAAEAIFRGLSRFWN